jgi:hypothetical protein
MYGDSDIKKKKQPLGNSMTNTKAQKVLQPQGRIVRTQFLKEMLFSPYEQKEATFSTADGY